MHPLTIDSFAGGGGASEGIEEALRILKGMGVLPADAPEHVDYAINHDDAALAMHAANHPRTIHLPHNVWKVSLTDLIGPRTVDLLWLSPDCRHHSRAKGSAPVSRSVRDLAWVAMRWLQELRPHQMPRRLFLENVREFQDWCPLISDGSGGERPDPARKGETFLQWVRRLKRIGYRRVEWRLLSSRDYGIPTIRLRLYLIATRDDAPIVWPPPTHGDPKSEAVLSGRLLPWPTSADRVIDWDRPCPSIFMTRDEARAYHKATGIRTNRPLAENTDARIAKGVKRFILDAAKPFIVTCNHGGDTFRGQDVGEPFCTVTSARDAHGLVAPYLVAVNHGDSGGRREYSVDEPLGTVTPSRSRGLVTPHLAPFITYGQQGGASRSADMPLHTVTASAKDTDGLAAVFLAQHNTNDVGRPADEALSTSAGSGGHQAVTAAFLAQHNLGVVGQDIRRPLSTVTGAGSQQQLVAAHMLSLKGESRRAVPCDAPHPTVCGGGQQSAVVTLPMLSAYYATGEGQPVDTPLRTVTTNDRFGLVAGDACVPPLTPAQVARAHQVAAFLRRHGCWDEREFVTVGPWIVVDIGMRMLTARELARANGLPESYILAAPYRGGALTDTQQRHKIGNCVNPGMATALVVPNHPAAQAVAVRPVPEAVPMPLFAAE